ncbi:MAG: type II secretion system protein M [Acidobacteriota bacterium]|nr:type II secretion system protein M [Acidobacteriota bacterium]
MNENPDPNNLPKPSPEQQPEIIRDDFTTRDSTVVVDEKDRTVLLTEDETIIIEKQPTFDIAPKNRPRKVNLGIFGRAEYIVVGLGLLSILATLLFYMFVVAPEQTRLNNLKAERDRMATELTTQRDKFKDFTTTEEQVARLVGSVDDFESRHLPVAGNGRTALYQRLNTLIAGYGLINTSGPDYSPLEINQRNDAQAEGERGRAKYQSLFPGVYVTMTVEGSYQNLRRFLRDLETSQQFIIVSTVELEPAENRDGETGTTTVAQNVQQPTVSNPNQPYARPNVVDPTGAVNPMMRNPGQQQPQQQQQVTTTTQTTRPAPPRGRTMGETVSLHIELAAYFKRNTAFDVVPSPSSQQQQQQQ